MRERIGQPRLAQVRSREHPPIFARGILVDVAAMHGVDCLPPSHGIDEKELTACLKHQGTQLRAGDVVLIKTRTVSLWPEPAFAEHRPASTRRSRVPAQNGAIMIGADNLTLERVPTLIPTNLAAGPQLPFGRGRRRHYGDGVPGRIVAEKVYEFAFFGACIKLRGATGCQCAQWRCPWRTEAARMADEALDSNYTHVAYHQRLGSAAGGIVVHQPAPPPNPRLLRVFALRPRPSSPDLKLVQGNSTSADLSLGLPGQRLGLRFNQQLAERCRPYSTTTHFSHASLTQVVADWPSRTCLNP